MCLPRISATANDAGAKGTYSIYREVVSSQPPALQTQRRLRKPKAMLLLEVCLPFSVQLGWDLLSERVIYSGGVFQAETFKVSYKWIYCSHQDTPSTHDVPTTKSVLPGPRLLPSADSCSAV